MADFDLGSVSELLEEIYDTLYYGMGIANLSIGGFILLGTIISFIISAVISLILYIVGAIPTYKLAKKVGRKWAILSWVPIFSKYFRLFVLSDIPGNKEISILNGQYKIKNRVISFWAYVGFSLFGNALITVIIGIMNLIPGLGQIAGAFTSLLYLVPTVICACLEYIYIKDVLDIFKPDKRANNTAAIILAIIDGLLVGDFAKTVYLYTLLKLNPLPENEQSCYQYNDQI